MRRNQKGMQPNRLVGTPTPHALLRLSLRRLGAALALLLLSAAPGGAQEAWEGNAAVVRRGTFPEPGMYAASNSFPANSLIEVRNLATGMTVQVTVLQRIEETDNIFLLLSEQAAERLGLAGSDVLPVAARVATPLMASTRELGEEQALSLDPDVNPAAELRTQDWVEPEDSEFPPEVSEVVPEDGEAPPEDSEPVPEVSELPPEVTEVAPETTEAQTPPEPPAPLEEPPVEATVTEPPAEQQRLAELQQRLPQKQLFLPPRQSERFALAVPEEAPLPAETPEEAAPPEAAAAEAEPAAAEAEPAELGQPTEPPVVVEAEPEEQAPPLEAEPRVSLLGPEAAQEELDLELPAPSLLEPGRPEAEGARLPPPVQEPLVTLTPEAPPLELPEEPAEAQPAQVAEAEAEPPEALRAPAPLSTALTPRAWFLQLGAYSSRNLAEKLASDIGPHYQVSILPAADRSRTIYKVLIGPLNTDESGTLLYLFKARGFKDAFLRYVE